MHSQEKRDVTFFQKLNHVMMAMAQLLNIRMPGSYELTFPPQNPEMPVVDGPGKGPGQSGMHLIFIWIVLFNLIRTITTR